MKGLQDIGEHHPGEGTKERADKKERQAFTLCIKADNEPENRC